MNPTTQLPIASGFSLPVSWEAYPIPYRQDSMASRLGIELMPRPGCAFPYRGTFWYFATEMQTVLRLEERVYLMIAALLAGATYDEATDLLLAKGFEVSEQEVAEILTGYRDLRLFQGPVASTVRRDIRRPSAG